MPIYFDFEFEATGSVTWDRSPDAIEMIISAEAPVATDDGCMELGAWLASLRPDASAEMIVLGIARLLGSRPKPSMMAQLGAWLAGTRPQTMAELRTQIGGLMRLASIHPTRTMLVELAGWLAGNRPFPAGGLCVFAGVLGTICGMTPVRTAALKAVVTVMCRLGARAPFKRAQIMAVQTLMGALIGTRPRITARLSAVVGQTGTLAGTRPINSLAAVLYFLILGASIGAKRPTPTASIVVNMSTRYSDLVLSYSR